MTKAKITDLKFDDNNANKGTPRGRGAIEGSIQKSGFGRSILVDKNGKIIAGNKSAEVAAELGFEDVVIVQSDGTKIIAVQRTDLDLDTDEAAKYLAIADNRSGQLSLDWDADVLSELSQDLDLSGLFFEDELAALLGTEEAAIVGEDDEEAVADAIDKAERGEIESRVSLGQVWKLGRHYICCADSTDEGNVRKLLAIAGKEKPDMVWADPPYGFGLMKEGSTGKIGNSRVYSAIANDQDTDCAARSVKLCRQFDVPQVWWGANYFADILPPSKCWIVWDKDHHGMTFADAELAWVSVDKPVRCFRHAWSGGHRDSEKGEQRVHVNQKPVALPEWVFEKYGNLDDLIFDPFLGSGISIVAAQQMEGDRVVVGFELSPEYCEIICQRFESLTGVNAELVGSVNG